MEHTRIRLLLLGMCIYSCQADVNLTWTADKDKLTLRCKTSSLIWPVQFLSPDGNEIAYCQIPVPSSYCYTSYSTYITVYQEATTNTTIVTYKGVASSLNGEWKCIYGHNVEVDAVNVTIRMKDTSMDNQEDGNCYEEFYTWTMFGFTIIVVVFYLLKFAGFLDNLKQPNIVLDCSLYVYSTRRRRVIVFCLLVMVVIFPVFVGSVSKECTYKNWFILHGFLEAGMLLNYFYNINNPNRAENHQKKLDRIRHERDAGESCRHEDLDIL